MKIRVYTLPGCISCELTLRAFRRRGIEPEEVVMTEEDAASWRSRGALSAPIVEAGNLSWFGLKPDRIREAAREALGRPRGDEST